MGRITHLCSPLRQYYIRNDHTLTKTWQNFHGYHDLVPRPRSLATHVMALFLHRSVTLTIEILHTLHTSNVIPPSSMFLLIPHIVLTTCNKVFRFLCDWLAPSCLVPTYNLCMLWPRCGWSPCILNKQEQQPVVIAMGKYYEYIKAPTVQLIHAPAPLGLHQLFFENRCKQLIY